MIKGMKFELIRSVKSGKNRLLLIGFVIYIIGFVFFLGYKEKNYDKIQNNVLQYELQEYGSMVKIKSLLLNEMDESQEGYEKLKLENDFYQSQYNSAILMNSTIDKRLKGMEESLEDNFNFIKAEQMKYASLKEAYDNGTIDNKYLEDRRLSIEEVVRELNYTEYLLEEKSPTVINQYTLNGANFLRNFFTGTNMMVVLIFILLFVIDSYVIELRDDCYKTIYTSPLKRNKLLFSKIISSYILVFLIVSTVVLFGFLVVSIIWGWGQLTNPVQVNEGVNGVKLIIKNVEQVYLPLNKLLIIDFISFFILILFIIIFSISLSVNTSNDILSFGVMLSIVMITYFIHSIDGFINFNRLFNPFAYIFFEDLGLYTLKVNHSYGMVLQMALSALIIGLTTYKFKSKDLFGIKGD